MKSKAYSAVLCVAAALLACKSSRAETCIGVIVNGSAEKEKFVPLLELRLSQHPSVVLVERREIEKVLREQQLQAILAPDAPGKRAALGKMLKADLLVFLSGQDKPKPHVVVTVCETQQGLRLLVEPVLLTGKPGDEADALFKQIEAAARKRREKITDIVAVPPLVNNSLTHETDYLQGAYAKFVERAMLRRPGLLVVELAEAKALAREMLLSGTPGIERRLPFYLMGEYRFEMAGQNRRAQFTWKLLRGEKELERHDEKDLAVDKVSDRLRQAAVDLVERALGKVEAPCDLEAEAKTLVERARTFLQLGAWQEAWDTAEASLLLKPDQQDVHGDAVKAIDGVYKMRLQSLGSKRYDGLAPQDALELIALLRATLPHKEAWLTGRARFDLLAVNVGKEGLPFPSFLLEKLTPEVREACLALRTEMRAMAVRVLAAKAAAKTNDRAPSYWTWLVFWTDPPFESANATLYFRHLSAPPQLNYAPARDLDPVLLKAWLTKHLSHICENRLKLLRDFSWRTDMITSTRDPLWSDWAPFVKIYDPVPVEGHPMPLLLSDPVYVEFLHKAEKLPVPSLQVHVRALLDIIAKQPEELEKVRKLLAEARKRFEESKKQGPLPTPLRPIRPAFVPVANPEVVFHPITLTASVPDQGEEALISQEVGAPRPSGFLSRPAALWIAGGGSCDMVWLDHLTAKPGSALYKTFGPNAMFAQRVAGLLKEKGRLRLLPLELPPWGSNSRPSACWDGSYFWIMGAGVSVRAAKDYGEKGLLAAIDPRSEKIWKFSGADGLPPSSSCAIAPMGCGKICVAGDFGRTWMAVAKLDPAAGIKLNIVYEARKVEPLSSIERKENDPQVAHPVTSMAVVAGPAEAGKPAQQRVVVGRGSLAPWLLDPEKKEATCPYMERGVATLIVKDNSVYCTRTFARMNETRNQGRAIPRFQEFTILYRIGFPNFKLETVNEQWVPGQCAFFEGCYHVVRRGVIVNNGPWDRKPVYCIASSLRDAPRELRCDIPGNVPENLCVSPLYGLIMTTETGFYQVEMKVH